MNNSAASFFFALIGILLFLSFILNKWINKELVETVKPSIVASHKKPEPPAQRPVVKEYDMNSDYPPSAPMLPEKVVPIVKNQERVLDKKIIYEMPTSDKFLLQ